MPAVRSSQMRRCSVCSGAPKPSCYRKEHVRMCNMCKNLYSGRREDCPHCSIPTDLFRRPKMQIKQSKAAAPEPTPERITVTAKMVYAEGPDRTMTMDEAKKMIASSSESVQVPAEKAAEKAEEIDGGSYEEKNVPSLDQEPAGDCSASPDEPAPLTPVESPVEEMAPEVVDELADEIVDEMDPEVSPKVPEIDDEPVPEADTEVDTQSDIEDDVEANADIVSEVDAEAEVDYDTEVDAQADAEADADIDAGVDSDATVEDYAAVVAEVEAEVYGEEDGEEDTVAEVADVQAEIVPEVEEEEEEVVPELVDTEVNAEVALEAEDNADATPEDTPEPDTEFAPASPTDAENVPQVVPEITPEDRPAQETPEKPTLTLEIPIRGANQESNSDKVEVIPDSPEDSILELQQKLRDVRNKEHKKIPRTPVQAKPQPSKRTPTPTKTSRPATPSRGKSASTHRCSAEKCTPKPDIPRPTVSKRNVRSPQPKDKATKESNETLGECF